ncbi:MAG: hypothetical protein FXF47_07770 [Candidatus Mcinerneyibacterium aminivorans]|jgi:hypothetical protein|uniref:Uncharacterized protein n=1 Tax=Candidatus Mcinerneyibacterium aminivorans TaxID=2703815 RepID=A0A5D0MCF4_9BACT|nr:MAG: hypothetical protein FXF47_07770 [Candidatus Mcinerneyibacterium aminivorans]
MKIEDYKFGEIVIDGKKFTSDLLIYENEIKSNWWRSEGHLLHLEDLNWVLNKNPKVIIIGTGNSGVMKVPEKLVNKLEERNMKIIVEKTQVAVKKFNERNMGDKVAAGFHLTC